MSVELKVFGGAYFPKDKALKKNPDLKPLAISIKSTTKTIAEAVIFGKLATDHPEWIEDYFKVKIWEHREGLPCPELDVFAPDFFDASVIWLDKPGEPAPVPAESETIAGNQDGATPVLKSVKLMDQNSRAACLVLFGPVEQITAAQYGQVVDLTNDDESSFNQNLAIAITKETRALVLEPERRVQLLAWVREKASESAQWPDIKKLLTKWIDTPADKREIARTETGATLGGGNVTDRDFEHGELILSAEIAMGLLARKCEFDIYDIKPSLHQQIAEIRLDATNEEFNAWHRIFTTTPGILDFSRAINIAVIKTAPENIWKDQVKHREYFNRVMTETDHANPDSLIVDIACGRSSLPVPQQDTTNEETRPLPPGEANPPANVPLNDKEFEADIARAERARDAANQQPKIENLGGGVFSVDALLAQQPSNEVEKQEVPPALCDRDIEIAHALNDLISGRTNIMSKEEAESVVTCTGHTIADVLPLLITDITTTEFCLSPDFSDDEIHNVATDILDAWSDDLNVRQKVALDGIVEYRKPLPPKSTSPDKQCKKEDLSPSKSVQIPESVNQPASALSYQQQLTIAALQGLCANPAHATSFDDLPGWAVDLADSVILQQEAAQ